MAWLESHQELANHPKTRRLARTLGINRAQAIGHLHMLWWWCLDYAQDGDLGRFEPADLADAADWDGDAEAFAAALKAVGFVTDDDRINDWHDYAGKLIERRKADAERKRSGRPADSRTTSAANPGDGAAPSEGTPSDVRRNSEGRRADSVVTVQNRTQTVPNEENAPLPPAAAGEPPRPRSARQRASDELFERRQAYYAAYCAGVGIAPGSSAEEQRRAQSFRDLGPVLSAGDLSPADLEALARYARAAYRWRDGKQTPTLAEVIAASPEWVAAGRPDAPPPKAAGNGGARRQETESQIEAFRRIAAGGQP